MKNKKTNQYFNPNKYPPVVETVWEAEYYDSPQEAKSRLHHLLGQKFDQKDFEVKKLTVSETSES